MTPSQTSRSARRPWVSPSSRWGRLRALRGAGAPRRTSLRSGARGIPSFSFGTLPRRAKARETSREPRGGRRPARRAGARSESWSPPPPSPPQRTPPTSPCRSPSPPSITSPRRPPAPPPSRGRPAPTRPTLAPPRLPRSAALYVACSASSPPVKRTCRSTGMTTARRVSLPTLGWPRSRAEGRPGGPGEGRTSTPRRTRRTGGFSAR
mmetsp:Transcript_11635/g.35394  ORF Transcript_11635/g.35394 Transcript_11635/m.35394 type:complete len:208 (+) Transcript_11635:206-829(+)